MVHVMGYNYAHAQFQVISLHNLKDIYKRFQFIFQSISKVIMQCDVIVLYMKWKNKFKANPLIWKLERLVFTAFAYLISILRYLDLFDMWMYPLALNQQTFERFNGIISKIYTWFPNKSLCSVTLRWSYLHIK